MSLTNRWMLTIWTLLSLGLLAFYWYGYSAGLAYPAGYHATVRSWGQTVAQALAPPDDAPLIPAVDGTAEVSVHIITNPTHARIRIMNIRPAFQQGMQLAPGHYDVEVSAPGYSPQRRWIKVDRNNTRFSFTLNRQ